MKRATKTKPTFRKDLEIIALETILLALEPFEYETRCRMVRYVGNWITDPKNGAPETPQK